MALVHRQDPYPHWEFTDPASGDQLRVVPERGGLITGWRCAGAELLYLDLERFRDPALSVRGGIPVLFPICGGLPAGTLPLPQHGFARDQPWQLAPLGDGQGICLTLEDSDASRAVYPHAFCLELSARLQPRALQLTIRVVNRGTEPLPFSLGLHPYIAVSSLQAVTLEGLPEQLVDQAAAMAPCSREQVLERLAGGVDVLGEASGPVALVDRGLGRRLVLRPSAPLDLVVAWTDPPRAMLCLEPWTAPRQALLSGERLLWLPGGETQDLRSELLLEPI